ncbi:HPr family phosphocarrier protein [Paenibacillus pasadenensis]|uniref:HPr family phosphocarrier protein n=1 Tax=Paenibacillus pasadenensis TaxID=217090 RepID=UPI00203D1EA8|nr:HPr family phosphocarrier protein [Paenibacillus pasadenensis]MCM3745814.1 HPr family phosphocarrier protein [Paenibacillus pasadenensis]
MRVHEFVITSDFNREDLTRLSADAARFQSDIKLEFSNGDNYNIVDVKSLLGMLLLPIRSGTPVMLRIQGKDETEAMSYMIDAFEK